MISKERMIKLVEEGKTIYHLRYWSTDECLQNSYIIDKYDLKEYVLRDLFGDGGLCLCRKDCLNGGYGGFDDFYETKEEAEFVRDFVSIKRTETLSFPTWDKFSNLDEKICIEFVTKDIKYQLYKFIKNKNTGNVRIIIYADKSDDDWFVFEKPLTKENYIEACRICKKLFLGEKMEG